MNHLLGRSSHLRLCAPRLYAPAKSNLAYPYAGAKSTPTHPAGVAAIAISILLSKVYDSG